MSEFMKFESTKSMSRWRPPKGTAGLPRARGGGGGRAPRAPAPAGGREPPRGLEVLEAEVFALQAAERRGVVGRERLARAEPARQLREPLELGVVLGHPALGG